MESKRVSIMFITMMMMVMGNFVVQSEAQAASPFKNCYPGCIVDCFTQKKFPNDLMCPLSCILTCLVPGTSNLIPSQMISANKIDYFCKLGCATHHCAPLSSSRNPNVDKVADCVDSCSDKCSNKN